jgi:hypothetical protein
MRGVAWAMGTPEGQRIIAVMGNHIVTRSPTSVWRSGMYMDGDAAAEQATRMTSDLEKEGFWLTAGPAEFSVSVPAGEGVVTDDMKAAISKVLGISKGPDLGTGIHAGIIEFIRSADSTMKRDFGL